MKKLFAVLAVAGLMTACKNEEKKVETKDSTTTVAPVDTTSAKKDTTKPSVDTTKKDSAKKM